MKVSARNVFEGIVASVHSGMVNAEVGIELPSGDKLVAVITLESVKSLQLTPGKPVLALIKAPWVMLMTDASGIRLSARNCLAGKVNDTYASTMQFFNAILADTTHLSQLRQLENQCANDLFDWVVTEVDIIEED